MKKSLRSPSQYRNPLFINPYFAANRYIFTENRSTIISTNRYHTSVCSVLIILFHQTSKKRSERQQTLRDYSTYLPILDEMILGMQQRQHLYKNQFLSLSQLLETGDMDSLKDTLAEITAQSAKQNASYHFFSFKIVC